MVSRRCAKSTGPPSDNFLRLLAGVSCLESGRPEGLNTILLGDLERSTAFSLELAVVACDTGCLGRELRSGGDSFGGGEITAASRELLELCAGVLRVAEALDGVLGRETGVFARAVAWLCCLDVRPLGTSRRAPAGELDRVDAGLAGFDAVPIFLVKTGSRDEDEWGEGDCSTRLRCCELVLIGGNLVPTRSLCDLV